MARWNTEPEGEPRDDYDEDSWEILFEGPEKPVSLQRPVDRGRLKAAGLLDAQGRLRGSVRRSAEDEA